jgi:hypothetical protein
MFVIEKEATFPMFLVTNITPLHPARAMSAM